MYIGIDYSLGKSNINLETGIRFGVISAHSVGPAWYEDAEPEYGNPTCPECGGDVEEFNGDEDEEYSTPEYGCVDYACHDCKAYFDSSETFSDEPMGWSYEDSEYTLIDCLDSDIMVIKSPYVTRATFCSPCVPGACSLDSPNPDGPLCYALGPEWFEDGNCPYPVEKI
jgi:hypothetical protein